MQTFCTEIKWYVCVIFDDFFNATFFPSDLLPASKGGPDPPRPPAGAVVLLLGPLPLPLLPAERRGQQGHLLPARRQRLQVGCFFHKSDC